MIDFPSHEYRICPTNPLLVQARFIHGPQREWYSYMQRKDADDAKAVLMLLNQPTEAVGSVVRG